MGRMEGNFDIEGDRALQPFVESQHPVTQERILLRDPAYQVVEHKRNVVTCVAADSFVAAVHTLQGANGLVELHETGEFVYRDALGAQLVNTVLFALQEAPTAKVLALKSGFACGQKHILQWKDQWPDTLIPQSNSPEATWAAIKSFKYEKGTKFEAAQDDLAITITATVDKKLADSAGVIPKFWLGRSPVYDGHAVQEVTLLLEMTVPEADDDGKLMGELTFAFKLWSPAAQLVQQLAMEDAAATMAEALGAEFTIIRGRIA